MIRHEPFYPSPGSFPKSVKRFSDKIAVNLLKYADDFFLIRPAAHPSMQSTLTGISCLPALYSIAVFIKNRLPLFGLPTSFPLSV